MGVAIISIGVMVIKVSERNMIDMKIRSGKATTALFRDLLEDVHFREGMLRIDLLQIFIDDFSDSSGAGEVSVVDGHRKILASTGEYSTGALYEDPNLEKSMALRFIMVDAEKSGTALLFRRYRNISVYAPLKSGAAVKVVFPLAEVNNLLQRTTWLMIFFLSFDLLLLFLFSSYLLSRRIVTPLKKLAAAAENIAEGDLSERVDYTGNNEIAQLAASFNTMADNLGEHVGYLQRANRELSQTRQELIRSEKLASVGRLAAGVAHEVGNPLGAILGYLDLLIGGEQDEKARLDFIRRIEKEVKKIDLTIRELLDYSRSSASEVRPVEVNKVVQEAMSLVSHHKNFKSIDLHVALSDNLPDVMADENQLQQVIINIVLNAVDAMPRGGALTLETKETEFSDYNPNLPMRRKGDQGTGEFRIGKGGDGPGRKKMVKITVKDTGKGIDEEDIEKIFDPFFTTKEPGKGTGLGLSISQGIIEAFKGSIFVSSDVGEGAVFSICLPVFSEDGPGGPSNDNSETKEK